MALRYTVRLEVTFDVSATGESDAFAEAMQWVEDLDLVEGVRALSAEPYEDEDDDDEYDDDEDDDDEDDDEPTIAKITRAYVRTYTDSGQVKAFVEWVDSRGEHGRTEGDPANPHMIALFARAAREGVDVTAKPPNG